MRRLIYGIRRYTVEALSLERMSGKYHTLALNYIFLMLYTTLESVFVNTLLFRIAGSMSIVFVYRGITYVATATAMHFGALLCQKKSPLWAMRIGSALYLLMYAMLLVGLEGMGWLYPVVAVLSGTGSAFYWTGHNVLVPHYTERGNRDIGISILGIIQGLMTLSVPLVSGVVIGWMPGNIGYRVMFSIGMLSVLAQLYSERRLSPIVQKEHVSEIRLALKLLWRKTSCKLMMGFEFCRGLRDGAFAFLLNMMLFEIVGDEFLVGVNTFLTGAAAIFGSWVYGRRALPGKRSSLTFLAALILTVTGSGLFLAMNTVSVMVFAVINAFFALVFVYSCNNISFDTVTQNATMRKCLGEMMALREGAIELGRIVGLAVVIAFPDTGWGYSMAILVLTLAQFATGLIQLLAEKNLNRKKNRAVPAEAGG